MWVLQEMPKKPAAIMGTICGYCKKCYKNPGNTIDRYVGITRDVKKPTAIMGLICGYYIFENLLMKFIIKNDVGIICLKCVYCFKTLQVM